MLAVKVSEEIGWKQRWLPAQADDLFRQQHLLF